jgi:hypothetical protein
MFYVQTIKRHELVLPKGASVYYVGDVRRAGWALEGSYLFGVGHVVCVLDVSLPPAVRLDAASADVLRACVCVDLRVLAFRPSVGEVTDGVVAAVLDGAARMLEVAVGGGLVSVLVREDVARGCVLVAAGELAPAGMRFRRERAADEDDDEAGDDGDDVVHVGTGVRVRLTNQGGTWTRASGARFMGQLVQRLV